MSKLPSIVAVVACSLANTFVAPAISVFVLPLVLSATPAWAEGTPVRVRGTVVSLDGSKLVVRAKVQNTDGQTVTVTYKGGDKTITIPANVPIVALVPADKSDIMPGAIVFVPTEKQADGTLLSGAILFGKDGVVPPM